MAARGADETQPDGALIYATRILENALVAGDNIDPRVIMKVHGHMGCSLSVHKVVLFGRCPSLSTVLGAAREFYPFLRLGGSPALSLAAASAEDQNAALRHLIHYLYSGVVPAMLAATTSSYESTGDHPIRTTESLKVALVCLALANDWANAAMKLEDGDLGGEVEKEKAEKKERALGTLRYSLIERFGLGQVGLGDSHESLGEVGRGDADADDDARETTGRRRGPSGWKRRTFTSFSLLPALGDPAAADVVLRFDRQGGGGGGGCDGCGGGRRFHVSSHLLRARSQYFRAMLDPCRPWWFEKGRTGFTGDGRSRRLQGNAKEEEECVAAGGEIIDEERIEAERRDSLPLVTLHAIGPLASEAVLEAVLRFIYSGTVEWQRLSVENVQTLPGAVAASSEEQEDRWRGVGELLELSELLGLHALRAPAEKQCLELLQHHTTQVKAWTINPVAKPSERTISTSDITHSGGSGDGECGDDCSQGGGITEIEQGQADQKHDGGLRHCASSNVSTAALSGKCSCACIVELWKLAHRYGYGQTSAGGVGFGDSTGASNASNTSGWMELPTSLAGGVLYEACRDAFCELWMPITCDVGRRGTAGTTSEDSPSLEAQPSTNTVGSQQPHSEAFLNLPKELLVDALRSGQIEASHEQMVPPILAWVEHNIRTSHDTVTNFPATAMDGDESVDHGGGHASSEGLRQPALSPPPPKPPSTSPSGLQALDGVPRKEPKRGGGSSSSPRQTTVIRTGFLNRRRSNSDSVSTRKRKQRTSRGMATSGKSLSTDRIPAKSLSEEARELLAELLPPSTLFNAQNRRFITGVAVRGASGSGSGVNGLMPEGLLF